MQKITTFLWFNDNAGEAAEHYVSIFPDSRVLDVSRGPDGKAFLVTFQLEGQEFMALNGGPHFQFTEAVSLFVSCDSQSELDSLWARLVAGGAPSQCGWLKDKFGLSWQIVPRVLGRLMQDRDPARAKRVMDAMRAMVKLDIAALEQAHASEASGV